MSKRFEFLCITNIATPSINNNYHVIMFVVIYIRSFILYHKLEYVANVLILVCRVQKVGSSNLWSGQVRD